MKNNIIGMLAVCLLAAGLHAQTYISGTISSNTTWDTTGNPYIVTGNTLLANGYTLTIEPGVIVRFRAGLALRIDGTLVARGTISDSIIFTSDTTAPAAGDWAYIFFSNSSTDATYDGSGSYVNGSILEYCSIQYAGNGGNYGAVRLDGAHPYINRCLIQHNSVSGIYASLTGTLRIMNNRILDNASNMGGGICLFGGTAIISGNTIVQNLGGPDVGTFGGGGIFAYNNACTIDNNYIMDNVSHGYGAGGGGAGIYIREGTATIVKNIIAKNHLLDTDGGEGGGILVYMSTATISDNVVAGNCAGSGGGIYGYDASQINNTIITGNTAKIGGGIYRGGAISHNAFIANSAQQGAGIWISGNVTYNTLTRNAATASPYGTIDAYSSSLVNRNNLFTATAGYSLYNGTNSGSPDLDATGNWWGTASDTAIQQRIYDWFDDANRGVVDYTPFRADPETLAPVSPPANPRKLDAGGGSVALAWRPNPETDVAGYRVHYGGFTGYSFTGVIDVGSDTSCVITGVSIADTFGITAYDHAYDLGNDSISTIVNDNMTDGHESWYAFVVDTSAAGISTQKAVGLLRGYQLYQNRPNPFNHITQISFTIKNTTHVKLAIYDLRGAVVSTLIDREVNRGSHIIDFNGRNLPNGVYFYRLTVGAYSETKKLILMK